MKKKIIYVAAVFVVYALFLVSFSFFDTLGIIDNILFKFGLKNAKSKTTNTSIHHNRSSADDPMPKPPVPVPPPRPDK